MGILLLKVETEDACCLTPVVRAVSVSTQTCESNSNRKTSREVVSYKGGAPIGMYNRRRDSGPYGESSEVSGVSVNNAKVGIYGRERKRPFYSDWPLL
ncbi:hypothetical protein TNCV_1872821 [Trichonephila clavipes]|nr:hypothetical protein TNCV_1872821 [Trichonephila clavipes]